MKLRPDQLSTNVLHANFDDGALSRGQDYFVHDRARIEQVDADNPEILFLEGVNRGSGNKTYRQHISICKSSREGLFIDGDCECPVGFNCKHVVAVCLKWKAGDPTRGQERSDREIETWLGRLTRDGGLSAEPGSESLLYRLLPARMKRDPYQTWVEFCVSRLRLDGQWGYRRRASLAGLVNPWTSTQHMTPQDHENCRLLAASYDRSSTHPATLEGLTGRIALDGMLTTGRLYWGEEWAGPLEPGPERSVELAWQLENGQYTAQPVLDDGAWLLPVNPPRYVHPERREVGPLVLPDGLDAKHFRTLLEAPAIPQDKAGQISRRLKKQLPAAPTPVPIPVREAAFEPVPILHIQFHPHQLAAAGMQLGFRYGPAEVAAEDETKSLVSDSDKEILRIARDEQAEDRAWRQLEATGTVDDPAGSRRLVPGTPEQAGLLEHWLTWIDRTIPQLRAQGWEIRFPNEADCSIRQASAIDAEIDDDGTDWFSLRFDLEVDGWTYPLLPLVADLIADYQPGRLPETIYLDAGDGDFIAVEAARIEPVLQTIVDLFDRETDEERLHLSRFDAPRLLELGEARVRGARRLKQLARRLKDFDGVRQVKPPTTFKGTLRDYQQQGLNWLQFLRQYEFSGILADDMGLGKTIQALANLAVEKRAGRMQLPSLIIAPTSLMGNWRREAEAFTPKLELLVLHGPDRHRHFDQLDQYDLVFTTYPLLPRDDAVLLQQHWHYLILDEAQQIKNPKAQAAQVVRQLTANHRLCLTGTPMENHLGELWAQFDFLMPGFLGEHSAFARNYRTPIEKHGDTERLERLAHRTAPFMLRRTKDKVASELPAKSEFLRATPMNPEQAALYESVRLAMEERVRDAIAKKGLARSHITILDALLKLRQVCCDPRLLPGSSKARAQSPSAKLQLLFDLLPEMLDEGRRILLFSQFTTMLGLIEKELKSRKIAYTKLTGQTRKREEAIERFRSGQVPLFLISLKAGGVGLNLTEADTVIHYDPWWNPAVETQATDRSHRIGQDKPVFVYKLITEGTVEEKILELQQRKQELADNIYGRGRQTDELTIDAEALQTLLIND